MALTLEDVGRQCGVSRSTVSRVINNSPLVNQATRDRVMKAIEELNYAPNFIARSLTKNCTETLAVTLPDISGGVFPEILAGVDEIASRRGYHLLAVFLGGARPASRSVEQLITHRRSDAILAVASTVDDDQLARMAERNMQVVSLAHRAPTPAIPSVLFDDAGGAKQATQVLLRQGRRHIVHIRGPEGNFDADERSRGYREALAEAGIEYDSRYEIGGEFRRDSGMVSLHDFMDLGLPFDAIFASNDDMAIGAIGVLTEKNLSIPDDVAVIGFDDIESARFIGLSTVRVPAREMGRVSATIAFDLIDGKTASSQVLPTEVIERASTTPGEKVGPFKVNGRW